jgi:hypothetical protein
MQWQPVRLDVFIATVKDCVEHILRNFFRYERFSDASFASRKTNDGSHPPDRSHECFEIFTRKNPLYGSLVAIAHGQNLRPVAPKESTYYEGYSGGR